MGPIEELGVSLVLVFAASLLFVNAIEYLAERLEWSSSFTGAVATPLFTSIPELFIFLVAVFVYPGGKGHEIALGTIFGEPFMTSTLSYFLVLLSVLASIAAGRIASRSFSVGREMQLPYVFIAVLFPWLLLPAVIHYRPLQYLMGFTYLLLYFVYILLLRRRGESEVEETPEEPYLVRALGKPYLSWLQVSIAAVLLYFGSTLMIESITSIAGGRTGTALSISIVLVPVATAIPETIAGMIWAFRGKNSLAIGSLVGENVLYATFYPGLALLLVPWSINKSVVISVAGTAIVSALYFAFVRRGRIPLYILPLGFIFYVAILLAIYV